jgi:probable phosphoglycerate mutase
LPASFNGWELYYFYKIYYNRCVIFSVPKKKELKLTEVYLIRHAEALGNYYRRVQGHWDMPLLKGSKAQLLSLEERFRGVYIDEIYSSDLIRAVDTAKALAEPRGLPIQKTAELRELSMGAWESRSWPYLRYADFEQAELFRINPLNWAPEGAENYRDAALRLKGFLLSMAEQKPGKTIAAFTHGALVRSYLCLYMGESIDFSIPHGANTSVTRLLVKDGVITVDYYNDDAHLADISSGREKQKHDLSKLCLSPLSLESDMGRGYYASCYRKSWLEAHGNADGFWAGIYLINAQARSRTDPDTVLLPSLNGKKLGVLELMFETDDPDIGRVALIYTEPEYRNSGLGRTLMGAAEALMKERGKKICSLNVAVTNENAIGFYLHLDYEKKGLNPGVASELIYMEKEIL